MRKSPGLRMSWMPMPPALVKREWSASHGDDLYRRAVYTHWQRTFLHPSLANFDAPTREECTVNRINSDTPLQALDLLNDPFERRELFDRFERRILLHRLERGKFLHPFERRKILADYESIIRRSHDNILICWLSSHDRLGHRSRRRNRRKHHTAVGDVGFNLFNRLFERRKLLLSFGPVKILFFQ